MKRILTFLILLFPIASFAETTPSDEPITIYWEDLLPEGELERMQEQMRAMQDYPYADHFSQAQPYYGGFGIVQDLVGQRVRLPGFVLPLDYQSFGSMAEVSEFLLVPYVGACIHVPPPPPNQIVYIGLDEPMMFEGLWEPIWVIGTLTAEANNNDLGNTAYSLVLESTEPYEY